VLALAIFLLESCSKLTDNSYPGLQDSNLASVSNRLDSLDATIAIITGSYSVSGNRPPVIEKGVCWSTSPNPVIDSNFKKIDTSKQTSFTILIDSLKPKTVYYVRAYATNSKGTSYGNQMMIQTLVLSQYKIGQQLFGGIIFYIDTTGDHGLVCATSNLSDSMVWNYTKVDTSGASATALGTGLANTNKIIVVLGDTIPTNTYAAIACTKYRDSLNYSDWFLPSKDELNYMYVNLWSKGKGGFDNKVYWSSSNVVKSGFTLGWTQAFSSGVQYYFNETFAFSVRPVRAF